MINVPVPPHRQKQRFEMRCFVPQVHPFAPTAGVSFQLKKKNLSAFTGQDGCDSAGCPRLKMKVGRSGLESINVLQPCYLGRVN